MIADLEIRATTFQIDFRNKLKMKKFLSVEGPLIVSFRIKRLNL